MELSENRLPKTINGFSSFSPWNLSNLGESRITMDNPFQDTNSMGVTHGNPHHPRHSTDFQPWWRCMGPLLPGLFAQVGGTSLRPFATLDGPQRRAESVFEDGDADHFLTQGHKPSPLKTINGCLKSSPNDRFMALGGGSSFDICWSVFWWETWGPTIKIWDTLLNKPK